MSQEQFFEICRTCMSLGAETYLFSPVDSFSNQIMFFADIKILPDDDLPDKICKQCVNKLETLKDFITSCKTSDRMLREILQSNKKINIDSENCPQTIDSHSVGEQVVMNSYYSEENEDFHTDVDSSENIDSIEMDQTSKKRFNELKKSKEQLSVNINEKSKPQRKKPIFLKEPIVCDDCGKKFSAYSLYLKHRRVHTGEKPFQCSFCPAAFALKGTLTTHLRTHTGEKPYACTLCDKAFSCGSHLKGHLRLHTGEKPFSCPHCPKTFNRRSTAKDHAQVHTEKTGKDTLSICSYCGKVLKSARNLKIHVRIHTGEQPYKCKTCGRNFRHLPVLRVHMRTHTGEKPYECDICNKKFTLKGDMIDHRNGHTNSRVHQCVTCNKMYLRKSHLRRHVINTHIKSLEETKRIYKKRIYKKMECHICLKKVIRLNVHMKLVHKNITEQNTPNQKK